MPGNLLRYTLHSAVLTGYLFRQWPACVHVPNWKNVLQVSNLVRYVWRFACVWCFAN